MTQCNEHEWLQLVRMLTFAVCGQALAIEIVAGVLHISVSMWPLCAGVGLFAMGSLPSLLRLMSPDRVRLLSPQPEMAHELW